LGASGSWRKQAGRSNSPSENRWVMGGWPWFTN
jgi:hypothetical protein